MPPPVWASASSAILAFLGASADELLILVSYFARASNPSGGIENLSYTDIIIGYVLGTASVLSLSALGLVGAYVPPQYIRLIGLFPVGLGVRKLVRRFLKARARALKAATVSFKLEEPGEVSNQEVSLLADEAGELPFLPVEEPPQPKPASPLNAILAGCLRVGVVEVMAATLAGGSEEVSLYLPLLASEAGAVANAVAVLVALAAASGVWLVVAYGLVKLPPIAKRIEAVGDAAEPWLMIGVGVWCLVGSAIIPISWGGS